MTPPHRTLLDRIEGFAGRAISRLPPALAVRLSGEPAVVSEGMTLDPHVQLLRAVRRRRNPHGLCEPTLAEARARYRRETMIFQWPRTPVASVRDFEVPGGAGQPLRVRHYAPLADGPRPLTVYLHGGGFTIGDLETHDEPCRLLCRRGRLHVLAVEYRLAPEHPLPAAIDDARAALRWAQANAAGVGADPATVGIGGDSAGANLAAVVSIQTRGERPPSAQLLIYPPADSLTERPCQALYGAGYFLDQADRDAFEGHYLRGTGVDAGDWRVSPLYAPDLSGLPPALLVSAGFDLLRDEGEAYADALEAAGSPGRRLRLEAHGHGFLHMTGVSPGARAAMEEVAAAWRELLEGTPSR
jgi:acetyl esterase